VGTEFGVEGGRKVTLATELPARIELTRGQRGGYGWVVSLQARTLGEALDEIKGADAVLRKWFLPEAGASGQEVQDGIRSEV